LVVWEVDSCEESEVGHARWYLAIKVERLKVQCNNTRCVPLAASNTRPTAEMEGIILPRGKKSSRTGEMEFKAMEGLQVCARIVVKSCST
jgi:hypothetical protein